MKTMLYYTSNREDPKFEEKIRLNVAGNSLLPLVSVSQKPVTGFGKNICVGDIGHSYESEWKQIFVGMMEIKTEYVVFCEADFLYPEDYFTFEPTGGDLYRHNNVWILWKQGSGKYRRKKYSEGAQIVRREFWLDKYKDYVAGKTKYPLEGCKFEWFGDNPCVSFKTGDGVRTNTATLRGKENHRAELPYWGKAKELLRHYVY